LRSRTQLRELAGRLRTVREHERGRIAREIHDDLGAALTALKLDLAWLRARLQEQTTLAERTRAMMDLVDVTIRRTRSLATELRPPILDELGLGPAVEWETQEFTRRTGIECALSAPVDGLQLDRDRSTDVYRILQEALTNVSRHAAASRVEVSVVLSPQELRLEITDNGRGIRPDEIGHRESLGLLGMRERAAAWGGEVAIRPQPAGGTAVTVTLPMPAPAAAPAP